MESNCYRCGSPVEGQTSFCPSCGAPQIRVSVPPSQVQEDQESAPPPPPPTDSSPTQVALLRVSNRGGIDWKRFLRVGAPLAAAAGLATAYNPLLGGLILLPGSVFLAVHVYRRRDPVPLRAAQGARMGALVGALSFAVLAVLFAASVAYDPAGYRQQMEIQMKEALARNPSPQAQQLVQNLFSGPRGIAVLLAIGMAVMLVFLLIISSVSGAVAASLARNKSGP